MSTDNKSIVYYVCRIVLRPLASILLKCGLTWKEFSDISKSVFVEVASDEYGINGRPTNVSRVSILTGISRKEIKRQRDLLCGNQPVVKSKTTDATRVLSGWFQDSDYIDANGDPRLLNERGEAPSFESLCERYSGDIAAQTMAKELLQTETIERAPDGNLRVKRRFYQPAKHDDENLAWGAAMIRDVAATMNNNVFLSNGARPRFGRKAETVRVLPETVIEFRKYLDSKGQSFLEEVDGWLNKHEASDDTRESEFVRLGVGMFAIEDELREENLK
ncbi:MAG: hypothetical protein K0U72_00385 [Gammaproteobacteria bacterium]|nr:hypothetical protein [Gammaproteobacteria bacterium]